MLKMVASCLFLFMYFIQLGAQTQSTVVGNWQGSMKVEGSNLHLVLHISQAPDGMFSALIDSIDQDKSDIPVKAVSFDGSVLKMDIAAVNGTYVGVLSKDKLELKGVWNEGKTRSLTFRRVSDKVALPRAVDIWGDWEGTFLDGGISKEVHLHIDTASCTTIVGTLDVPADGAAGVLIRKMTFVNDVLEFAVEVPRITYSGVLNHDTMKFDGVWNQGRRDPLSLQRASHPFREYERPKGCRGERF